MNRSFHWKRLLVLVAVLFVVGGVLFFVNRAQARKQASVIKGVAEKAEAAINGDINRRAEAIALYERYLKFEPKDEPAAMKYAELLIEQTKYDPGSARAAIDGLERVLRTFPDHADKRQALGELYLRGGNLNSARQHFQMLYETPRPDPAKRVELLELLSVTEQGAGNLQLAIDYLEQAIKVTDAPVPLRVRVYQRDLELLNMNKSDRLTDAKIANHMRTLLEKDPFRNDLRARVVAARFELFRRELENARRDIKYAMTELKGNTDPDTLMAAAELELAEVRSLADMKQRLAAARSYLQQAFDLDPKNVTVGLALADVLVKADEPARAVEVLSQTARSLAAINDQYWVTIDRLIDLGNSDVAQELVERAAAEDKNDVRVGYFRGRLALLKDDWAAARTLLEDAAPGLTRLPEHHKRAMVGLARIYDVLQNPDRQLLCYRAALRNDAGYAPALIGEAEALARLGNLEEAIAKYRTLVTVYQLPFFRPALAKLRLLDTLRRPPENRQPFWERFDSEETLGPEKDRPDELRILQAQGLAARGERDRAIAVLEGVLKKDKENPQAAAAWVALARIKEAGKPEAALNILESAQKEVGDNVDLRLARAEVLVYRAKPPIAAEFESLAREPDKFLKPDRYRLWFGLGQAALNAIPRLSDPTQRMAMQDAAARFLTEAANTEPRDLLSRAVLVDLAMATDRKQVLEAVLGELEKLEGPNGPISTLGQVVVALPEVRKIEDKELRRGEIKKLREKVNKVKEQRPGWGRVYVAQGRLDELEGLTEQAIESFKKALREGDRQEYVLRRVVELYRDRKQDALAAGLLDELSTKMILPDDLERFRAIYEMLNRVVPRSERPTIDRIAPVNSTDYKIQMLRGSLLAAIRDEADALKAFRRAVELTNPPLPETYDALIRQLVRTSDIAAAKLALAEAERVLVPDPAKLDATKADLFITLGQCHELVGDLKTAEMRYREAVRLAPKELNPNRRLVEFLMRTGKTADADALLQLLTSDAGEDLARWARRYYAAVSLMSRPTAYNVRKEALALIDRNLAAAPNDKLDIKARAVILTVDPVTREEGIQILKEHWTRGELTPDESYLLGRLIFDQGPSKIPESIKFFESAAKPRQGVTLEHIAALLRVYLAINKLDLAKNVLERLKSTAPNSWEATREEARVLMREGRDARFKGDRDEAQKKAEQARKLILDFPGHDTVAAIRNRTGPLLVELGFYPEAESLYKQLLEKWDSPVAHTPLAILYIQQKQPEKAIALAREREAKAPVLVTAQIQTGAARVARPGKKLEDEMAQWLEGKIKEYAGKPELAGLIAAKAELLDAQGNYSAAIAEYRRAVKEGNSDSAQNNLAVLLALHDPTQAKADEAIAMISKLIDLRGPAPSYLDTRAVAYILKGGDDIAKAAQDLEMALIQQTRPVYLFHLAWVYDLQGKRLESDAKIREARAMGITAADVHPIEREKYFQLFGPDSK